MDTQEDIIGTRNKGKIEVSGTSHINMGYFLTLLLIQGMGAF
jgi:hypothetical protein